jgi:hypothetical protein
MKLDTRIEGPALRFNVSGTLSRRARVGMRLLYAGAWLIRVGGVKDITVTPKAKA